MEYNININVNINECPSKRTDNTIGGIPLSLKKVFFINNAEKKQQALNVANKLVGVISNVGFDTTETFEILNNITPSINILDNQNTKLDNQPSISELMEFIPNNFSASEKSLILNDLTNDNLLLRPRLFAFEQANPVIKYLLMSEVPTGNYLLNYELQLLTFSQ